MPRRPRIVALFALAMLAGCFQDSGGDTSGGGPTTSGSTTEALDSSSSDASTVGESESTAAVDTTGSGESTTSSCEPSNGGVEICDGLDNDCDGTPDQDSTCVDGCEGAVNQAHAYMFCERERQWAAAQGDCEQMGAGLAIIETASEDSWITGELFERFEGFNVHRATAWIGGDDIEVEGEWTWLDGTLFWSMDMPVDGIYANWGTDEPNSSEGPENCLSIFHRTQPFDEVAWNDAGCTEPNYPVNFFVCESTG